MSRAWISATTGPTALGSDGAGVVVIPQEIASELLERLQAQRATMAAYLAGVKRGQFSNEWVDRILQEAGCITPTIEAGD